MRMSAAARQPCNPRTSPSSNDRGRGVSRSPAASPLRSRSPILSPLRGRTPPASPLRAKTPPGSPLHARFDDTDRQSYVLREAAATAVRYHAFLASTTEQHATSEDHGSSSSSRGNRSIGSPRRASAVLGAKETKDLLYGEAEHKAEPPHHPRKTPVADFWHMKSMAETAKEKEAETLQVSAVEACGGHRETQEERQEEEEEEQQHVSPSASDLEAEDRLLDCIYDNTLYECPSSDGCRNSAHSDSQAVDAHADENHDEDVSLSLTPNPTFQPSRRLSCSPAAEDDEDMPESGGSETPSRSLSGLQLERLKLRQKEQRGLVGTAEERQLMCISDDGPDRSDDLPAQIPVEFTPGLMPVSAFSCPRRTALRSPWSGWSEASDTEDPLPGSACDLFGDDFSFGKGRRADVGGLGGLGRRLCLADDDQLAEDDPEDCGLQQQHEREEGPHREVGPAWEVGAEDGGFSSEAIVTCDEIPHKPAPLHQDASSRQVPTDDSGGDSHSTESCFSADSGLSCPGRETQLELGGDDSRPVVSPQLSTEESQIVNAFLHTTTAGCTNPERDIIEAEPSESPETRVGALRATTSASSSWGSSSTLPYGPIPVAANPQRPPGGHVMSSAAHLPPPSVAQGTRRGRPLVPCRARSSRSMSPALRAVAAATEASRRFLDGSGSSSDDDEASRDESLTIVHAGARAVPRAEVARLLRPSLEAWRQEASIQRRRDTILTAGFKSEARCRRLETVMSAWNVALRLAVDLQSAAADHAAKACGRRVIAHWAAVTRQSAEEADRLLEAALGKARSIRQGQVFAEWRILPLLSAADKLWNAKRASAVFQAFRDIVSEARHTAGAATLLRHRSLQMAAFRAWSVQFMAWVRDQERQNARADAFATAVSARRQIEVFRSWRDEVENARECRVRAAELLARACCRGDLEQWRSAVDLQKAERTAVGWRQMRLSGAALNAWILFWARQMAVRVMVTHCRLSAGCRALRAWRDAAAGLRADLLARAWEAMVEHTEQGRRKALRLLVALKRADASLCGRAMVSWLSWWDWRRKKAAAAEAGAVVLLRRCLLQWLHSSTVEKLERQLVVRWRSRLVSAVFGAWRRRVRIVIGLAALSIARLVAMGSEVLRGWLAAAREEAELRRCLLRSTFLAWAEEAERSADLQERLVVFLTASFEDCLARAFGEWRDAKAVRLMNRQHVREAALCMATRGHLVRSVKAWRDYIEGRRFARTGALSQIIEAALASAQQLELQPGEWFHESGAGQTLDAALQAWRLQVRAAQRSRAMALELSRSREEGLMTRVLREWLHFVERNVGILYLQHRLKACMQEELVQLRGQELAAAGFCDRARRSRAFTSWRNALLQKGAIARVHRDSRLLAWALMIWAHISAANRQVRISQGQLSDVRKKIEAFRAAEGAEHAEYPSISLSGIEAVGDDSDCFGAADEDLEGAAHHAEITLRQSTSSSNQQVLAGNQIPGLEGQTARMSELLRAYGDRASTSSSAAGSPQKRLSLRERQCSALLLSRQGYADLLPSVHTLLGTDRSGHPAKQLLPPPDEAELSFEHLQQHGRGNNFGKQSAEPVASQPVAFTPSRNSGLVDGNQRRLPKAVRNISGSLSDQLARVRRTQAPPMDTPTSSRSLYFEQQSDAATMSSQATPSWALPDGSGLQRHPLLSRDEQGSAAFEDAGGDPFSGASSQIEMSSDDDSVEDICRIRSALALHQ